MHGAVAFFITMVTVTNVFVTGSPWISTYVKDGQKYYLAALPCIYSGVYRNEAYNEIRKSFTPRPDKLCCTRYQSRNHCCMENRNTICRCDPNVNCGMPTDITTATTTATTSDSTTKSATTSANTTTEAATLSTTSATEPPTLPIDSTTTPATVSIDSITKSATLSTESTTEPTTLPTESTTTSVIPSTDSTTKSATLPTDSITKAETLSTDSTTKAGTLSITSTTEPTTLSTDSTTEVAVIASGSLCAPPVYRVLSGSRVTSDCPFSGIANIIRSDGEMVCNAVFTIATVNGTYEATFITTEYCKQRIQTETKNTTYFDIMVGDKKYPIVFPFFKLIDGSNGAAFIDVTSSYRSMLDHLGPCQKVACPYSKKTMSTDVDFNTCKILSWGATSADGTKHDGLQQADVTLSQDGCSSITDQHNVANTMCFRGTQGSPLMCSGDVGAPVYCQARSNGEWIFIGLAVLPMICNNAEIKVIPYPG